MQSYKDLREILLDQISHFFAHYKDLEPEKWAKITGWEDAEAPKQMILKSIERAKD